MGNTTSFIIGKSQKSLEHIVNYISAQYIRKQNFKQLSDLSNPEFCDNLVILTSKIINEYLDEDTIKYLAFKKGIEDKNIITSDKIIALDKKKLNSLDIKDPRKKQRVCIGIAKHYIQIAHIFAAISSTLNPQYTYKDPSGETLETPLIYKENIPEDAKTRITRNNLCSNRLKILLGNQDYADIDDESEFNINPNFCSLNKDKTLSDEPGIPELKQLYLDKYDYSTGKFTGMTPKMEKVYQEDVETLYKAFSGNKSIPKDKETGKPTITRFSKIPLKDFYNSEGCVVGKYTQPASGQLKKQLFGKYADNIKQMIVSIKTYNSELLNILDQLFVFGINPETKDKQIVINPKLTDAELNEITSETKNIIIKLYTFCESSFVNGLKIYEAIIKNQKLITTKSQIDILNTTLQESVPELQQTTSPILVTAEVPPVTAEVSPKATGIPPNLMVSQVNDSGETATAKHTKVVAGEGAMGEGAKGEEAMGEGAKGEGAKGEGAMGEGAKGEEAMGEGAMGEGAKEAMSERATAVGERVMETMHTMAASAADNVVEKAQQGVEIAQQALEKAQTGLQDAKNKTATKFESIINTVQGEGEQVVQNVESKLPHLPKSITSRVGGGRKKKKQTRKKVRRGKK